MGAEANFWGALARWVVGGWFELGKGNVWEEPDDLKRGLRCVSLRDL